jgi:anionic cell wall polymer biosynthesis LytR-Cps2A-Psr (LCP) family protein
MSRAPGASRRPHRSWKQRLLLLTGTTVASVSMLGAGAVWYVGSVYSGIHRIRIVHVPTVVAPVAADALVTQPTTPAITAPAPDPGKVPAMTVLLTGSDGRSCVDPKSPYAGAFLGNGSDIGQRSDTILLMRVDPAKGSVAMLSFPRDLWVNIPGHGMDKINSAFEGGVENGGPQLMAKTVFGLSHIPIDHYLYVDLNGFQQAVDKLGGVNMCVPPYYVNTPGDLEAVDASGNIVYIHYSEVGHVADPYTGLDVLPGCQHLGGTQALAYVRARHNLPCSPIPDFARIGRQQQFMRALINQMLRPSEIAKAPGLVGPVLSSLHRDSAFSAADLVYLVGQMRGVSTGAVQFRSVSGTNAVVNGLDVVKMDPADKKLFTAIRNGTPLPSSLGTNLPITPPSPANTTVEVLDAGNASGADEVEGTLSEAGFDVGPGIVQGAMPKSVTKAAIVYAPGKDAYAQVVQSYFPGLPMIEVKSLDVPVAVVVPHGYSPSSPTPSGSASPPPTGTECPGTTP